MSTSSSVTYPPGGNPPPVEPKVTDTAKRPKKAAPK